MDRAYSLLLARCGLSQREAAEFHDVRVEDVRVWLSGRVRPPVAAIAELRALYRTISVAADEAVGEFRRKGARELEISVARHDAEARSLGLPCVGAHAAMVGMVAARLEVPVTVVTGSADIAATPHLAMPKR